MRRQPVQLKDSGALESTIVVSLIHQVKDSNLGVAPLGGTPTDILESASVVSLLHEAGQSQCQC